MEKNRLVLTRVISGKVQYFNGSGPFAAADKRVRGHLNRRHRDWNCLPRNGDSMSPEIGLAGCNRNSASYTGVGDLRMRKGKNSRNFRNRRWGGLLVSRKKYMLNRGAEGIQTRRW